MANEWYVQHGGKQYGPMTSANLKKLASEGKITPATTVRLGNVGAWVAASRVQGLFTAAQVAATPPAAQFPTAPAKQTQIEAPPIIPPPPIARPMAQLPRAAVAPLPKAVPTASAAADGSAVTAKILGAVAIILGTVAVATCGLQPVMQGYSGWVGIVVGVVGLAVSIGGLVVSAKNKGAGLMLNVSGASGSAVGLVLAVVIGIVFGLFTSAPKPVAVAPVAKSSTPPKPAPIKIVEPEPPPEPQWIDASQPIQQGDIKAQIVSATIESVALEANDLSTIRRPKPQPMLKIRVAVENTSTDKILQFPGWTGGGDLLGGEVGRLLGGELGKAAQTAAAFTVLTDNIGNPYKQTPSLLITGAGLTISQDNSLRPGKQAEAQLVFPLPLENIEYLRLELSPGGFGGSDSLRFQIPKAFIAGLGG